MDYCNSSSGDMAFEPFPIERENVHSDSLLNYAELIKEKTSCFNGIDIPDDFVTKESLFDDVDVDFFIDKFYPLDYLLTCENSAKLHGDNFSHGSDATPLGSPIPSFCFDEFSLDFLDHIDKDDKVEENKGTFAHHDFEPPVSSNRLIHDEVVTEVLESSSSPDNWVALPVSPYMTPDAIIEHGYAKTIDSDNENECFELSSPNSVDSGISTTFGDDNCFAHDDISDLWSNLTPATIDVEGVSVTKSDNGVPANLSKKGKPHTGKQRVEKKLLRKEHNRKSATKYRKKKKEQSENVFCQADKLEKKNQELKIKVDGIQSEINYLKGLVQEVLKTRLTTKDGLNLGTLLKVVSKPS